MKLRGGPCLPGNSVGGAPHGDVVLPAITVQIASPAARGDKMNHHVRRATQCVLAILALSPAAGPSQLSALPEGISLGSLL